MSTFTEEATFNLRIERLTKYTNPSEYQRLFEEYQRRLFQQFKSNPVLFIATHFSENDWDLIKLAPTLEGVVLLRNRPEFNRISKDIKALPNSAFFYWARARNQRIDPSLGQDFCKAYQINDPVLSKIKDRDSAIEYICEHYLV